MKEFYPKKKEQLLLAKQADEEQAKRVAKNIRANRENEIENSGNYNARYGDAIVYNDGYDECDYESGFGDGEFAY